MSAVISELTTFSSVASGRLKHRIKYTKSKTWLRRFVPSVLLDRKGLLWIGRGTTCGGNILWRLVVRRMFCSSSDSHRNWVQHPASGRWGWATFETAREVL